MADSNEKMDKIYETVERMKHSPIGFMMKYTMKPKQSSDLTPLWPKDGCDKIREMLSRTCTKDNTTFIKNGIICDHKTEDVNMKVSCVFLDVAGQIKLLCTNKAQYKTQNKVIVQKYEGEFYSFDN